jgi:DNA-binding MarR family transcriptional regulator
MRSERLVDRGLILYRDLSRVLHERGAPAWLHTELTFAQLRALFTLADYGPTPIGRVAGRLGIGLPAASSLVDRLVEQGLVRRREDPLDRRRTLAETTGAGQALAQRLRQGSREALRAWLEQMDGDDLAALVRGLEALFSIGGASGRRVVEGDRVGVEG